MSATLLLLGLAIILWLLAAIAQPWTSSPISLGWLGLFFYGLSLVIGK